jgi:hypothetical protein
MTAHAHAVPSPQFALAPTKYRPPLSTGFLRMRKEEFKGFAHLQMTAHVQFLRHNPL